MAVGWPGLDISVRTQTDNKKYSEVLDRLQIRSGMDSHSRDDINQIARNAELFS